MARKCGRSPSGRKGDGTEPLSKPSSSQADPPRAKGNGTLLRIGVGNPAGVAAIAASVLFALVLVAAPTLAQTSRVVLEDKGKIIVVGGEDCSSPKADFVELREQVKLPLYVDRATVLLDGWHLTYSHDDHHVQQIGAAISDVQIIGAGVLRWLAQGRLRDKNGDDPFSFCYTYTALGWSDTWIDAVAHNGNESTLRYGDTTAQARGVLRDRAFAGKSGAAVLPRGFLMGWTNVAHFPIPPWRCTFNCQTDHHVLQAAFVLDQSGRPPGGDGVGIQPASSRTTQRAEISSPEVRSRRSRAIVLRSASPRS